MRRSILNNPLKHSNKSFISNKEELIKFIKRKRINSGEWIEDIEISRSF